MELDFERVKTKDRILLTSLDLLNKNGVAVVTTNHVAKEMAISPGNLYFHFANKEEIIRQIFKQMTAETYDLWRTKPGKRLIHPLVMIEKNFELFWKYRFFHREMYYLRRKDAQLSKLWKAHIQKVLKLMTLAYKRWIKAGWMETIKSPDEIQFLVDILLSTSSSFLQFFESADKTPAKKPIETGKKYVARLLIHYTKGEMRADFQNIF